MHLFVIVQTCSSDGKQRDASLNERNQTIKLISNLLVTEISHKQCTANGL